MNATQNIAYKLRLVAASILFTMSVGGSATAQPPLKLSEWKSSKGTTIQAAFYSFDEDSGVVTLLVPKEVKLDQLDPESRTLAKGLASLAGLSHDEVQEKLRKETDSLRELEEMKNDYLRPSDAPDISDRRRDFLIRMHTIRADVFHQRLIELEEAGADGAEMDAAPKHGEKPNPGPAPGRDVEPVRRMTSETFSRLKGGMTFQQVVEIVGPPDEEVSSVGSGSARAAVYYWKIGEFGNAHLVFQAGMLYEKAMLDM